MGTRAPNGKKEKAEIAIHKTQRRRLRGTQEYDPLRRCRIGDHVGRDLVSR